MPTGTYTIREMQPDELRFAVDLAKAEGWNPGLDDQRCFFAADPHGFLIGELDGEPISSISAVRYGDTYGFLGFYIVKPEYRKQKYGLGIWNAGMQYLANRDVGLDGVVAQIANYEKSGFQIAYFNARYEGQAAGGGQAPDARIVELATVPFAELLAYDTQVFAFPRAEFLRAWISQPGGTALGIRAEGRLAGYAVLRPCFRGYKIGPLFADDEQSAEALFQAVSARAPQGTPIFLDIPDQQQNPAAHALVQRHAMRLVFETARMYRRCASGELRLPLARWFGVTTFELG